MLGAFSVQIEETQSQTCNTHTILGYAIRKGKNTIFER